MRVQLFALLLAGYGVIGPAAAQTAAYPLKAVRVINPFAAGGGLDLVLRPTLQKMGESTPDQFAAEIRADIGKWAKVAKAANIRQE